MGLWGFLAAAFLIDCFDKIDEEVKNADRENCLRGYDDGYQDALDDADDELDDL